MGPFRIGLAGVWLAVAVGKGLAVEVAEGRPDAVRVGLKVAVAVAVFKGVPVKVRVRLRLAVLLGEGE
jgi:hypothetical protein